jgi:putative transposase
VFPGIPHHVTQRGNHRERVFLAPGDAEAYLSLLNTYAKRHQLKVFAYCLMPNHVHLVTVPASARGMFRALCAVHGQYAQRINRMRETTGHLWQGEYRSSPLDGRHFLNAVRYVERNPVAAGLVTRAEVYPWSSAAAHCGLRDDPMLEPASSSAVLAGIADWQAWLAQEVPKAFRDRLKQHGSKNLPCGSSEFVDELGKAAGRDLRLRPRGGRRKG